MPTINSLSPELINDLRKLVREEARKVPNARVPGFGNLNPDKITFAKIGQNATVNGAVRHDWKEVRWDFVNDIWVEVKEGREGNKNGGAYVVQWPDPTVEIPEDTVVQIYAIENSDTGQNIWVAGGIGGSLPAGQYMGMHYMNTSQNQSGFSFPFFGAYIG